MSSAPVFVFPEDPKEKILEGLNDQQKAVVQDYKGFSMVTAGAGAGKTKTIVSRTAYMIEDGVPASAILLFSFTKKAANEIKERIVNAIGDKAVGVTVSTYHSFCARLLRRYCSYIQYADNFTIIDEAVQKKLISKILEGMESSTDSKEIASKIASWKGKHLTPQQAALENTKPENEEALIAYEAYQQALRQNNVMDFDDLLFHMVTILEQNEIVRHQVHSRYKYITADECQDSSVLDTKFIFLLTNPQTMNLCLVGDQNQAIYGFRGADVDRFMSTIDKYPHKDYMLGQNYRSTPEIVDAANSLIQYNPQYADKMPFSKNSHGEKVAVMECRSQANEADRVAELINKLVKSGQMKYSDAAILYRNSFISRNFEDSFRRYHIPYQVVGGISFYKRMEVQDILAFLTFFENPRNMEALERIINVPKAGIGKKSIEKINKLYSQKCNKYAILDAEKAIELIEEVMKDSSLKRIALKGNAFAKRCKKAASFIELHQNVGEIVSFILTEFDYGNYLRDYDEETCDERLMNVRELQEMAAGYDSIQELLEDILTVSPGTEDDSDDEQVDAVQLMTMHASKGLEFPLVFIVSANDGIIPSWRCESEKDIQEERRLFYVAMTRAKENLVISSTKTTLQRGRCAHARPSQFISQIDSKYVAS